MAESTQQPAPVQATPVTAEHLTEQAGWPRPKAPYSRYDSLREEWDDPVMLPTPWINGSHTMDGDWLSFRENPEQAHRERLCAVCGLSMQGLIVMGVYIAPKRRMTAGPGCHPRCLALAVTHCPHLKRLEGQVGWLYRGPGAGHQLRAGYGAGEAVDDSCELIDRRQLRQLARLQPLGVPR